MTVEEEKLFVKGFNHGYQLSKHEPELLTQLLKGENNQSHFFAGMIAGDKQQQKEKFSLEWDEKVKAKQKDSDRGYER